MASNTSQSIFGNMFFENSSMVVFVIYSCTVVSQLIKQFSSNDAFSYASKMLSQKDGKFDKITIFVIYEGKHKDSM